jgi:hypothetical protein
LQVTSAASQAIKEALQAAGIDMPTEIYTLAFRDRAIADIAVANAEAIAEKPEAGPE